LNYWKKRYNDRAIHATSDLQHNVGRTKGGVSISEQDWTKTVEYIVGLCGIDKDSEVMELCCGNGMLLGPISRICRKAIGVDYSEPLIHQLKENYTGSIEAYMDDALLFEWKNNSLDVIIIYFSIQHFSEKDCIRLVERSMDWLKHGGRLFIGDIPDDDKKWSYLSRPEYKKDYLTRIKDERPLIGHWFKKDFYLAFSSYRAEIKVQVLDQPEYQINSQIRFDVLMTKE